jgi:hypothetical protein
MKTDFFKLIKYLRSNKSEFTCLKHNFAGVKKVPTIKDIIECELNYVRFIHKPTGIKIAIENPKKSSLYTIYSAYIYISYQSDLGNTISFDPLPVSKNTVCDSPESVIRFYIDGAKTKIKDQLTKIITTAKEEIRKFKNK